MYSNAIKTNTDAATQERILQHYKTMLTIRRFEEKLLQLFSSGQIRGTAHVCLGQEAVAAGACAALNSTDQITSNHRGHGHLIAKGGNINKLMAEFFGKSAGYALGRGGSQHVAALDIGFLGSNGITGGGLPIAVGAALSMQLKKTDNIVLAFFGDGASAQGAYHEAANLAAVWQLPIIFLCENNNYAMGTVNSKTAPQGNLSFRAAGYAFRYTRVDGQCPLAVENAVAASKKRILAGFGPEFIEANTVRLAGHSRSDQAAYRSQLEMLQIKQADPLPRLRNLALSLGIDLAVLENIETDVSDAIGAAVKFSQSASVLDLDKAAWRVFPEPSSVVDTVSSTDQSLGTVNYENWPKLVTLTEPQPITGQEAAYLALKRAMQNKSVIMLGEDIAAYGGAFRVSRDLVDLYGAERVRDTPISENGIVGCSVGLAMTGWRPVVEIMFMDFILLALDQLANHAAKYPYLFGCNLPLVVRTTPGGRRGYGATHSQCFENILLSIPGLQIFSPSTPQELYDQLLTAIFGNCPTVVLEHKLLYGVKGMVDENARPLGMGQALVVRSGEDVTVISHGYNTVLSLAASDELAKAGISVEVVDLRSLCPLDQETILNSAIKTQHVVVVEESVRTGGIGAEIASQLQEDGFGYLDAPILRVAAVDSPIPANMLLEQAVIPGVQDIIAAIRRVLE